MFSGTPAGGAGRVDDGGAPFFIFSLISANAVLR